MSGRRYGNGPRRRLRRSAGDHARLWEDQRRAIEALWSTSAGAPRGSAPGRETSGHFAATGAACARAGPAARRDRRRNAGPTVIVSPSLAFTHQVEARPRTVLTISGKTGRMGRYRRRDDATVDAADALERRRRTLGQCAGCDDRAAGRRRRTGVFRLGDDLPARPTAGRAPLLHAGTGTPRRATTATATSGSTRRRRRAAQTPEATRWSCAARSSAIRCASPCWICPAPRTAWPGSPTTSTGCRAPASSTR